MLSSHSAMRRLTIGIDFRPALSRMTGVGRYVHGLTRALANVDPENLYVLFSSSFRERARPDELPVNVHLVDRRIPVRVLNAVWHRLGRPSLDALTGFTFDITHSPHPLILPSRSGKSVVTIHDLFFYRHPALTSAEIRRDYPALVEAHARRADAILVVSETTATDVQQLLGIPREKITVTPNGFDPVPFEPHADWEEQTARSYHLPEKYILSVATFEPRKNLPRLVEAADRLRHRGWEGSLVLAGGPGLDEPVVDRLTEQLDLRSRVTKLGYVPPPELPAIYRRAQALVSPSLWEGFGLSMLEAMCCGVAVVASDIPAHREVAGDAAHYVDPKDPESIASGILRVLGDASLRERLLDNGRRRFPLFSWEHAARQTLAVYRRLGDR